MKQAIYNKKIGEGFTLIEVIIAIFILTVGIAAVLRTFPLSIQIERFAQMTTVATHLGQAKIEEIEEIGSKSYPDIKSETKKQLASPFSAYSREVEVTCYDPNGTSFVPNCPDTGVKKIKVTVSWGISFKKVELFSLIAKR